MSGEVPAPKQDAARLGLGEAGDGADELGLAVAVDAAEPEDLAGAQLEREVLHAEEALRVAHVEMLDREEDLAGLGGRLVDVEVHLAADHHLGHALLARSSATPTVLDQPAPPQDRAGAATSFISLSLCVMRRTVLPSPTSLPHDPHELVDLLGREHGGGLVEDEDLGVAVEHLEDLDALLHADRDVLDLGLGIDVEAVELGELADAARGLPAVDHEAGRAARGPG